VAPPINMDLERLRQQYDRRTRKAAIDILQSANYVDKRDYPRAFANAEAAATSMVEDLRALKRKIDSVKGRVPGSRNPS